MAGKIISSIIVLTIITLANIKDFARLIKGATDEYVQANSGMLYSLVALLWFVLGLDRKNIFVAIILIYGIYLTIYTLIFFEIKKYKKERDKEEDE